MTYKDDAELVLLDFFPHQLAVISHRISQSMSRVLKEKFDLQIPEWRILVTLYAVEELSFSEVSKRTSMTKARVSRAQNRMVDLGLLSIRTHSLDKRQIIMRLSARGRVICREAIYEVKAYSAWLLKAVSVEERIVLRAIMPKLLEHTHIVEG